VVGPCRILLNVCKGRDGVVRSALIGQPKVSKVTKTIVLQDKDSEKNYEIDLPCVVGRGDEADLKLADPSISHRHVRLFFDGNRIQGEDLQSANGVYVNGERIVGRVVLESGDCLQLGRTQLVVGREKEDLVEETLVLHSLDAKGKGKLDLEKLETIYEISAELSENQDVGALAEKIFSRLKDIFKQDRSYLALFREDGTLQPILPESAPDAVPISKTVVSRVFKNGQSLLLEDALSETSLKDQDSVIALRIRSALCVPLIYHSQMYGLLYLDRHIPGAYTQDDLAFMTAIAAMLGPLIENARLWSELRKRYAHAVDTLRETQARLIEMERKAAYGRLAQAMAHEIRNPLMGVGGLVRRIDLGAEHPDSRKLETIITLVERLEGVLKEVDTFVELPLPEKRLERVDQLVQAVIDGHDWTFLEHSRVPQVIANTSRLMIPLDAGLFKRAVTLIFQEMASGIPKGAEFDVTIRYVGNQLEIVVGPLDDDLDLCQVFDPALKDKPWGLDLFLNIAHRIISDHGGKLLLDPRGDSAFPVVVRLPTHIRL